MADGYVIHVNRRWQTNESTISEFQIENTQVKGYFLEEKGPSSPVELRELRIPAGEYKLDWWVSGKFRRTLPRLYNDQVPRSRYILIHHGNSAKDTEGCLIAGSSRSVDWVSNSIPKLTEIMAVLRTSKIENCRVVITEDFQ